MSRQGRGITLTLEPRSHKARKLLDPHGIQKQPGSSNIVIGRSLILNDCTAFLSKSNHFWLVNVSLQIFVSSSLKNFAYIGTCKTASRMGMVICTSFIISRNLANCLSSLDVSSQTVLEMEADPIGRWN